MCLKNLKNLCIKRVNISEPGAYSKAKDALVLHNKPVVNKEDLNGIKGIGNTIIEKFQEFKETGTLHALEKREKQSNDYFYRCLWNWSKKGKRTCSKT